MVCGCEASTPSTRHFSTCPLAVTGPRGMLRTARRVHQEEVGTTHEPPGWHTMTPLHAQGRTSFFPSFRDPQSKADEPHSTSASGNPACFGQGGSERAHRTPRPRTAPQDCPTQYYRHLPTVRGATTYRRLQACRPPGLPPPTDRQTPALYDHHLPSVAGRTIYRRRQASRPPGLHYHHLPSVRGFTTYRRLQASLLQSTGP